MNLNTKRGLVGLSIALLLVAGSFGLEALRIHGTSRWQTGPGEGQSGGSDRHVPGGAGSLPGHVNLTEYWEITSSGNPHTACVGDVDNDGRDEVVVGYEAGTHSFRVYDAATKTTEWTQTGFTNYPRGVVLDDLNENGTMEVVVVTAGSYSPTNYLYAYNGFTRGLEWSTSIAGEAYDVAVKDVDADGHKEVVVASSGGLEVFDAITRVREYYNNTDPISSVELADLDGDGDVEIVEGSHHSASTHYVAVMDGVTRAYEGGVDLARSPNYDCIRVLDVDNDTELEVVVATTFLGTTSDITIFTNEWSTISNRTVSDDVRAIETLDFDFDGFVDLCYTTAGAGYAGEGYFLSNITGGLDGDPILAFANGGNGMTGVTSIVWADFSNDTRKDLIMLWEKGGTSGNATFNELHSLQLAAPVLEAPSPNPSQDGHVALDWSNVSGARWYDLYRHPSPITEVNASVTLVRTTTQNHTEDALGADGSYYYAVVARNTDNSSAVSNTEGVTVDMPGPATPVLVINDGDETTNDTRVTLKVTSAGATEACFSNNGTSWTAWEPFAESKVWWLADGEGEKTVFCRVRNATGEAGPSNDTIVLQFSNDTGTAGGNETDDDSGTSLDIPGVPPGLFLLVAGSAVGVLAWSRPRSGSGKKKPVA
ncbi:MAG: FG-GAP-like repeat-containing protein [Promethearchaeota archaeon]